MANIIGLDLNVDQDYLAEAVRQTVIMGISESLNGKNEIVSQIVKMTLNTKVSDKGTISNYERDNRYTLLEYYVRKAISEVAAEEMQTIVNERKPEIAKAIREELSKKVNYTKFVDAFIDNVSTAVTNTWVPKIEINFANRKDD